MLGIECFSFSEADHRLRLPVSELIQTELYRGSGLDLEDFSRNICETEDLQTLALINNGLVIATASARTDTLSLPVVMLRNVAVSERFQGRGYGKAIMNALEQFIADDVNFSGSQVAKVVPTDKKIGFYRNLGYEYISPDSDFMAKVIS
jgi:GNAT superfamily N-acetyltransferase